MPYEALSIRVTTDEKKRIDQLKKDKKISQPEIFRRGLEELENENNVLTNKES